MRIRGEDQGVKSCLPGELMQRTWMGSSSLATASSMIPSASTTAHWSRENCSSCSFWARSPSRQAYFFFFLNTLFNRWPQRYSAQLLCCPYCKHGTIPVAVTGHVSFPAPCCSVASRAPVNSGAAEPVVWGRPAPPPVPSLPAATLPSLPAGLQVCCSSEYHSADKSSTEWSSSAFMLTSTWKQEMPLPFPCSAGRCLLEPILLWSCPAPASACQSPTFVLHWWWAVAGIHMFNTIQDVCVNVMLGKLQRHWCEPVAAAELSAPPALCCIDPSPGPGSPAAAVSAASERTAQPPSLWKNAGSRLVLPAELPGCCSPESPPWRMKEENKTKMKREWKTFLKGLST